MKYANKGKVCDTLCANYEIQIAGLTEIIHAKDQQIDLGIETINRQLGEINDLQRRKKIWKNIAIGLGVACLVELVLLL